MEKMAGFCIILAGICWGIIGIFSRNLSLVGFTSVQITTVRCLVTAICLLCYIFIFDKKKITIQLKDIWIFFGTGVCSIVFFNICYFITVEQVTLSVAAILLYMAPSMVMIMSLVIFREKITPHKIVALCLAFVGCIFMTGVLGTSNIKIAPVNILIGLGSGFGYALYSIFGKIALKKYHPLTVTAYTFLVASVCLVPFSGVGDVIFHQGVTSKTIINVLLLGVISTLAPFILYTKGLEQMEAGRASIMAFVEPMVATLVGIIVFGEAISISNGLGILLIFSSILLLNLKLKPFE